MMHVLKALPELISAGLLFMLWNEPQRFGAEWFKAGALTMLLEFFVVHSAGVLALVMNNTENPKKVRALQVLFLFTFYVGFLIGYAHSYDAWWMLYAFLWLLFSKLQAIWSGGAPVERDRAVAITSWALSVAVFLGSVGATAALDVPRLGVTDAVRDAAGFSGTSTGLWEAEPWRALAGAVLYFTIMGLSRPLFARWQGNTAR